MKEEPYDHLVKILMIGESGVGKTCIIQRFNKNEFSLTHLSTIAIDFKMKVVSVGDEKIKMQIWDTAGQERFNTLTAGFFKGSDGIILCYSITDNKSFENINKWMAQIKSLAPIDVKVLLVGNKTDLEDERKISMEQGKEMADKYGIQLFEASAKTGENVTEVFQRMAELVLEKVMANPRSEDSTRKIGGDGDNLGSSKKKKCCKV